MRFASTPGLLGTKQHLIQSVRNSTVAHAVMLDGAAGGAALPMALAYITYLYCQNPGEQDSCGECANCRKLDKLSHPDLSIIFPTEGGKKVLSEMLMAEFRQMVHKNPFATVTDWIDTLEVSGTKIKQGNIPVEESRRLIQNLSIKSYEGGYKTVLIWCSELMGGPTANALLKILEEPPADTLFVLVSYNYQRNIRTILSRTQRVGIESLQSQEVALFIEKEYGIAAERAKKVAFLADGNIREAIKLAENDISDATEWFANWLRMIYAFDLKKIVPSADDFAKLSKDDQKTYLEYSQKMLREIYLEIVGVNDLIRLEGEQLVFVQKIAKAIKFENFEKIINHISTTQYFIERNVNAKVAFLDLSLSLASLIK